MDGPRGDEADLSPEVAFGILGQKTRLEILFALWRSQDSGRYPDVEPVTFSELRERVGMRDGSKFNYHLKKLVGTFVHRTDEGYVLRRAGERVVAAVLSGTLTDGVVLDGVSAGAPCALCGGDVVMDYGVEPLLDNLVVRCTDCEGAFDWDRLSGVLFVGEHLPGVGVDDREEAAPVRAQSVWNKRLLLSQIEGVCPHCAARLDAAPVVCPDHRWEPGRLCETCGTIYEVLFDRQCEVCHVGGPIPLERHLLADPTVAAFYHDHDVDPWGPIATWPGFEADLLDAQTVLSEDPFEVEAVLELGGDRLTVRVDGSGTVVQTRP